jgi:DNA-binding LytR/AlgR family response regulator
MTENPKRRVVIVDDNLQSRNELNYLIKTYHPDLEVIGDFEDTASALPMIESGQAGGVFLDINFEEKGKTLGLELADRISRLPHAPWIIFITGYPENVWDVIKFRPFGFITKPIDYLKLADAIPPAPAPPAPPVHSIEIRYKTLKATNKKTGNLVESEFITRYLVPKEIKYVQSNQGINTVKVYLVNGEVLDYVTLRLNQWLDFQLPCFVQISKNTIVHLKYVSGYKIDSSRFDAHLLTFRDDPTELAIGSTFFTVFRDALRLGKSCCG